MYEIDHGSTEFGVWNKVSGSDIDKFRFKNNDNPLLGAAKPILIIASSMRDKVSGFSNQEILHKLEIELQAFQQRAEMVDVPFETIKAARYCLCTLVDEFAAKFGWADSSWSVHSLLVTFHSETWGGEQFFNLLNKLKQDPQKHINLIELMYYSLSLGYMGKYKILDNGELQLDKIKYDLKKLLSEHKNKPSLTWVNVDEGQNNKLSRRHFFVPIWVLLVFAVLILSLLYTLLSWKLGNKFEEVNANLNDIVIPKIEQVQNTETIRLAPLLQNEIERKLITVDDTSTKSTITILGDGLFESGSVDIRNQYFPVLAVIAQALNVTKGQIVVSGFSDNVPIRSITYPSNWHLSQSRADVVKKILLQYITDPSRIRSEGRGASNPIDDNSTAEARAKNRRVEITLYVSGEGPRLGTETEIVVKP